MNDKLKVSILCITYNHEKFIGEALESFISQKTNFDFEVIVHDDASADKTPEIIREFKKKCPHIIRPIFQTENQYSKGVRGITMKMLLPHAKSDYIALCEGDDYFTDENKLQIQADFLDKNPEYSMCFHPIKTIFEDNDGEEKIFPDIADQDKFTLNELLKGNFMGANSVMYRRQNYEAISKKNIMPGDWYLHLFHAKFGKIGFINKVMAIYRRHKNGIWHDAYHNPDKLLKDQGIHCLTMYFELLKLFGQSEERREIINNHIFEILKSFINLNKKYNEDMIRKAMKELSEDMGNVLVQYINKIGFLNQKITQEIEAKEREMANLIRQKDREMANLIRQKNQEISNLKKVVRQKDEIIRQNDFEVERMKSSKFWKLRAKYMKIKKMASFGGKKRVERKT